MLDGMPGISKKSSVLPWKRWMTGGFLLLTILSPGVFWIKSFFVSKPRQAPEAERILTSQAGMPFQVLIPAYLPESFDRERMVITTNKNGPNAQEMIQLTYPVGKSEAVTISQWAAPAEGAGEEAENTIRCLCVCESDHQCNMAGMELNVGSVRVRVEFSTPNLLPYDQFQLVLDTLGPAANRQVYSSIEDIPLSLSVPPPVEVPVGADGVQEVILVATPEGYSPVHFSVQKDVPVRLIFRQLGYVGCGNELIFQWGARDSATLILTSPGDKQVLEFTPEEAGEFRFNCPHLIYRGVMTVTE